MGRVLVSAADRGLGAEIKQILEGQGLTVLGPFLTVKETIPFSLDRGLSGAILEDRLLDGITAQIGNALSRRGVAVVTFTATDGSSGDAAAATADVSQLCAELIALGAKAAGQPQDGREARPARTEDTARAPIRRLLTILP